MTKWRVQCRNLFFRATNFWTRDSLKKFRWGWHPPLMKVCTAVRVISPRTVSFAVLHYGFDAAARFQVVVRSLFQACLLHACVCGSCFLYRVRTMMEGESQTPKHGNQVPAFGLFRELRCVSLSSSRSIQVFLKFYKYAQHNVIYRLSLQRSSQSICQTHRL